VLVHAPDSSGREPGFGSRDCNWCPLRF
jgi:hypothetical protein